MRTMYEIKELLKSLLGIPSDRFLAKDLGLKYEVLRNRVSRNSIPFKEILFFCHTKGINPNKILYPEAK